MNREPQRGHLVVTRRSGESVMIGDAIEITLLRVDGNSVRLGVTAPRSVKILRREIWDRRKRTRAA